MAYAEYLESKPTGATVMSKTEDVLAAGAQLP